LLAQAILALASCKEDYILFLKQSRLQIALNKYLNFEKLAKKTAEMKKE